MGGGSKKQTVGYRYYLGEHLVFCHGPVDKFKRLTFDSTRVAWEGFLAARGSISVQANMIFGGEDIGREGGVSGTLNFEPGEPDQPQNAYLQARLGTDIPAFRGVTALVFNQMYLGTSPYMKKVSARFTRIMKTTGGELQWYAAKAAVGTIADQPLALYFAIDCSGSMDDITSNGFSRLTNMKTALKAVLDFIDENAVQDPNAESIDIFFSAFGTQPDTRQTISRFDVDSTDIEDLKDWIDGRTASLWTYFPAGVMDAPQFFNEDSNPAALKKLFFITDGEPSTSDSSQTATQIAQAAHDLILSFEFDFSGGGGLLGGISGISFAIPGLEAYGINIDLPDTTYTAYCDNTPGDGVPVIDGADPTALVNAIASAFTGQEDMNPAHIIRECLTDNLWGMGYNAADIDDDAFEEAADTLYAEGFGISILWDQQMPIEQFVGEIIKHIDASLYVDRRTGKFVLKLIRGGYDIGTLPLFDESNIDKLEGFTRPTFGELTNSVSVNYWDSTTGKTASLTIEDPALILMQGATINTTLQYPGLTNALMAARVASRDLKTLSNPLASCTIYANTDADDLNIGSVIRFSWAEYGIVNMPMRVSGIGWGDGVSNKVKMSVAQDVFALPESAVVIPPGTGWTDPNEPPGPVQRRSVQEMSYFEMYQLFGEADLTSKLSSAPDVGRIAVTGARPTDTALNASLSIDAGAGYEAANVVDFCPAAQLTAAVDRGGATDTETWTLDNWIDQANVHAGISASIGTEKVYVVSVTGNDVEVKRGVLDTVPQAHADNTWLLFDDEFISNDGVDYTASDVVNVKMLTATGEATLDPQYAPVDTVTFASRAIKPYPAGDWQINGETFPEDVTLTLNNTWVPRNRLLQTSPELVGFYDAGVTEEAGVSYTLRLYNAADVLLEEDTGVTGTSHSVTPPVSSGTYTLELAAVRDSYEQYYSLRHTFDFTAALPDDVLATSILGKLRHYYPMSETSGTVLKDLHGGADMTLLNTGNITYNGTTVRAGASYGAMRFASTARASINGNPLFLTEQDNFSLFAWYRPDAATGAQRALTCNAPASDASEAHNITVRCTFASADGMPEWFWEHGVGTNDNIQGFGTAAITAANQAVAFVRDSALSTVTNYLNNAAAGTTTYTDQPTGGTHVDNEFTLANTEDENLPALGYLQDMMLFAEPLTLDEVVYLYNSANGKSYADIVDDATLDYLWTPSQLNDKAVWVISDHADNVIASGKATKLNNLTGLGGGTIYTGNGAKHGTTTLNSRPVLTADGTDSGEYEFLMTRRETQNMTGITIVAVHKMRVADTAGPTLKVLVGVNRAGGTAGIRADLSNSSSSVPNNARMGGRRLDADGYASVHDNTDHGTAWRITIGNNNYSTGVGSIYVNGVQLVSTAAVFGTGASSNTTPVTGIMLGRYVSGNTHGNYELAEMLVIRGNLGSTDREKLEGYLAHKWGLTANLDVAHPYKTDPPLV